MAWLRYAAFTTMIPIAFRFFRGFSVRPLGLRISEASNMEKQCVDRERVLRQVEEDLQDSELAEKGAVVLTWAKARVVALDKLEDAILAPYRQ